MKTEEKRKNKIKAEFYGNLWFFRRKNGKKCNDIMKCHNYAC